MSEPGNSANQKQRAYSFDADMRVKNIDETIRNEAVDCCIMQQFPDGAIKLSSPLQRLAVPFLALAATRSSSMQKTRSR